MPIEPIVVSYSELDTYRQCPLKHRFAYKERWTKDPAFMGALSKGSLWHSVMEAHYGAIRSYQQRWAETHSQAPKRDWKVWANDRIKSILHEAEAAVRPILFDLVTGQQDEEQALVWWMYQGYVDLYDIDADWWILGIEVSVVEPLRNANGRKTRYHLKTKIDLIVKDLSDGGIWIVDHKSGQNLPSQMDLEIDDQFGLYTLVLRWRGTKVRGQIHNAARTQRNMADYPTHKDYETKRQPLDARMRRTFLNRTDVELDAIAADALATAQHAWPPVSKTLPVYSSPDPRQCGWKCDFKEVHLLVRQGAQVPDAMDDFQFVQNFERH